jgi:hypothetical protein
MPLLTWYSTYKNSTTGNEIDFYEVDVKPFEQQVYKGKKPARLVGYDGISPGPTFRMTKGREAVVRFKNHGDNDLSISTDPTAARPLTAGPRTSRGQENTRTTTIPIRKALGHYGITTMLSIIQQRMPIMVKLASISYTILPRTL